MDPATAATAANPLVDQWDCLLHGRLPVSHFAKEDLRRKRHRCKRCLAAKMASYRARQPLRHIWHRFLQSARKEFIWVAGVNELSWRQHGEPLLEKLFGGVHWQGETLSVRAPSCFKLAWEPHSSLTLDLQKVHLVWKDSRAGRAKGQTQQRVGES